MANFINPYNFISLSTKEPAKHSVNESRTLDKPQNGVGKIEEKFTGSIKYTLKTKTSLFIPNMSSEKAFEYNKNDEDDLEGEHKLMDFFSLNMLEKGKTYDDEYFEPRIPGSEVRGMIRSIYETLTNSCLSKVNGNVLIGKRTVEHFKPGIIKRENNCFKLYEANDILYRDQNDFRVHMYSTCAIADASKVDFNIINHANPHAKPDAINVVPFSIANSKKGKKTGYLIKGENGPDIEPSRNAKCDKVNCPMFGSICFGKPNGIIKPDGTKHCIKAEKHCAHIFTYKDKGRNALCSLNDTDIERFKYVIKQYQDEDPTRYVEYKNAFDKFLDKEADGLPVYYSYEEGADLLYLSPACITREVYKNTIDNLTEKHKACNPEEKENAKLCPACDLFGMIGKNFSKGSKIRFSDLTLVDPEKYSEDGKAYKGCYDEKLLTLDTLAQPKLANTEFYLKKPIDPDGEVWFWTYDYYTVKKNNGSVILKSYEPEISGRKFYWNNRQKVNDNPTKTNLNKTCRTVKENVTFEGVLYFDGITRTQLKQLIKILDFTSDEKHGYKLGTGKPLGLGSVELKIEKDSLKLRSFNLEDGSYRCDKDESLVIAEDWSELDFDTQVREAFERMTRYLEADKEMRIHYPYVETVSEEGYQWYGDNKENYSMNKNNKIEMRKISSPHTRKQTKIIQNLQTITGKSEIMFSCKKLENTVQDEYIRAEVYSIDHFGNVYLKNSEHLFENPRVLKDDVHGREYKQGDEIKVLFKRQNRSSNGKMYSNYVIEH